MLRTMKGKLYLAPIDEDKVQNILDIGTGTGTCRWICVAMRHQH